MRFLSQLTSIIILTSVQSAQAQLSDSRFLFRFYDDETWVRVVPSEVILRKQPDGIVNNTLTQKQIAANGTAIIDVEDGRYDVEVKAPGYHNMSSWFVMKGQPLRVNFSLIPVKKHKELSAGYLAEQHRAQCMTITGYLTDTDTGLPLSGVTISTEDKVATATSDSNGYYLLQIPIAANIKVVAARYFLRFSKVGYTTEERTNFDAWSKGDMILRLRMQKGSGCHQEAMLKKREPIQETLQP